MEPFDSNDGDAWNSRTAPPAAPPLLLHLPADVLSLAHSFLSARDLLCTLAPTSRSYAELVLDDSQLWQGQCERQFSVPSDGRGAHDDDDDDGDGEHDEADPWFAPSGSSSTSSTNLSNTDHAASASAASASSSSCAPCSRTNRWLRLYRSFLLTPPRPLQLQVLHVDDDGYMPPAGAFPNVSVAQLREIYSVHNLLRPSGKAYCSGRNRNVHVVLALARTARQRARDAAREAAPAQEQASSAGDPHAAAAAAAVSEAIRAAAAGAAAADSAASPCPAAASQSSVAADPPLPSSFLLTDLKIIAPARGYTSPLSSGFVFFCDALPTPAQIGAWDDWSAAQWAQREQRLAARGESHAANSKAAAQHPPGEEEAEEEVAPGEGEPEDAEAKEAEGNDEQRQVESWYADGPVQYRSIDAARASSSLPASFPLRFAAPPGSSPLSSPTGALHDAGSGWHGAIAHEGTRGTVVPLVGFFHLERNGQVTIDPLQPASASDAAGGAPSAADGASSSSSVSSGVADAPLSLELRQAPYSYRHRFPRPVHGRFIVLTFLRASRERSNIDVSYFGVKGYRRGVRAVEPIVMQGAMEQEEASASLSDASVVDPSSLSSLDVSDSMSPDSASVLSPPVLPAPASSPSALPAPSASGSGAGVPPAPEADPDAQDDAFDFDAPLASVVHGVGGGLDLPRLRQYLRSVSAISTHMAADVSVLDQQLARVQQVMQQQQAAQQQQHALRLRMLLLQTQQLQLQLTSQQLQTQATLQHAARLNANAAAFLQQRREQTAAVEAERALHRARLRRLTEEKEREERLLTELRARVAEAKEREERLQETVNAHRAAVAAADAARQAQLLAGYGDPDAGSSSSSSGSSSSFAAAAEDGVRGPRADSDSSSGSGAPGVAQPVAMTERFGSGSGASAGAGMGLHPDGHASRPPDSSFFARPSDSVRLSDGISSPSFLASGPLATRTMPPLSSPSASPSPSVSASPWSAHSSASRTSSLVGVSYSPLSHSALPPSSREQAAPAPWTAQPSHALPVTSVAGSTSGLGAYSPLTSSSWSTAAPIAPLQPPPVYPALSLSSLQQPQPRPAALASSFAPVYVHTPSTAPALELVPPGAAVAGTVAPSPTVQRDYGFSARTQELLDSLRASRLQREAEHARRLAESRFTETPRNPDA